MKLLCRIFALISGVFILLGIAGCSGTQSKPTPVLHLFTWAEFVDEGLIRQFEEENGCRVVVDTFGSNSAMYAKLSMGAAGYDLVTPTTYYAEMLQKQGRLRQLEHDKILNLKNLDPDYQEKLSHDPQAQYSVPYLVGTVGLAYHVKRVANPEQGWQLLTDDSLKGRTTLLTGERAVLGAALLSQGKSLNSSNPEEIQAAADRVIEWRKNVATFDNELFKSGLANGEFWVCMAFSGDTLAVSREISDVRFILPEQGYPVIADVWVIPQDAPQAELAHEFINFMLRAESAAKSMEATCFWSPNRAAYEITKLSEADKQQIMLTSEQMAKGEVIRFLGEENEQLYQKEWERVRSGRP